LIDAYLHNHPINLTSVGINQPGGSTYFCLWCICKRDERFVTTRTQWHIDGKRFDHVRDSEEPHGLCKCQENLLPYIPVRRIIGDRLHLKLRIFDQICTRTVYKAFETYKVQRHAEIKEDEAKAEAIDSKTVIDRTDPHGEARTMHLITTEFKRCGVFFAFHPVVGASSKGHASDRWGHTPLMGPAKTIVMGAIIVRNIFPDLPRAYTDWLQVKPISNSPQITTSDHHLPIPTL
jgi:hypothetical protein